MIFILEQVFEALRNMDAVTNSPKSTTSTPPSLDTVVSLLRTTNVEPLVRDLAKEIEGRFELLRTQIREGKDNAQVLDLIRDQEKNILHAVHQVPAALECNLNLHRTISSLVLNYILSCACSTIQDPSNTYSSLLPDLQ